MHIISPLRFIKSRISVPRPNAKDDEIRAIEFATSVYHRALKAARAGQGHVVQQIARSIL